MLDDRDAPPRGARGSGTIRRAVSLASLLLLAAAAGCGRDAPLPAPAAADSAAVDSTTARAEVAPPQSEPETPQPVLPPPEPPAPETTWVRLAHLESDSRPRVRRRTFRSDTGQFRVIVELRESTTTFNQGRVRANILSPRTTLPIRTVETRILPLVDLAVDTAFVDAEPGEYTLYILHDFGVREWSVVAEAPSVQEEPR